MKVAGTPAAAVIQLHGEDARSASITIDGAHARVTLGTDRWPVVWAVDGTSTWVHVEGTTWVFAELPPERRRMRGESADRDVRSPMPGKVIAVADLASGDVEAGASLVTIEAMKMEHALDAPAAGTVELLVGVGDQVDRDQVVARVHPRSGDSDRP